MQELTNDVIKTLAAANGLTIPDDRLDLVRRQYEDYLRTLAEIATLPLAREAEPAPATPLAPESTPTSERRR